MTDNLKCKLCGKKLHKTEVTNFCSMECGIKAGLFDKTVGGIK